MYEGSANTSREKLKFYIEIMANKSSKYSAANYRGMKKKRKGFMRKKEV